VVMFQTCKQLNVLASSSLNIGFAKADRLRGVIQREVFVQSNWPMAMGKKRICRCRNGDAVIKL